MSPLALDPRDQLFRTMLALSVGFHVVLFLAFLLWSGLHRPPPRFIPVTVVDLVGGPGPEPRPEKAEARPAPPAKGRSRERVPAAPRAKAARERTAKKEAPRVPKAVHPDTRAYSERIKKMKEEKRSEEDVREAVNTVRRMKEAQAAVAGVRERVARRVDLSALPSPPAKVPARPGPGPGGGGVTSGVPPEEQAYARMLYEKIYESWVLLVPGERRTAGALVAMIRIKIEKDGRVSNVRMEESSGNRYFDDSVLRAIGKASPLPLPPGKLREREELYDVVIKFREPPKGQW